MRFTKKGTLALVCMGCFISACVASTELPTTPAVFATSTFTVSPTLAVILNPTSTLTPTPTPTPTPTVGPTNTPTAQPTNTPALPTATISPTLIVTPLPMREITVTEMPSISPDGHWKATVLEGSESAILRVSSIDGTVEWIAETITDRDVWGGFEWAIPFHWSQKGYLYFTHHMRGDGCISQFHGSDLHSLNLQTGEVTEIVPKVGYWLALSPDEETLAYLSFEKGLVLYDLESGSERRVHLNIGNVYPEIPIHKSHLLWSPDGNFLVLTIAIDVCGPEWSNAIVQVDATTLSQTILIHDDEKLFYTMEWMEASHILLWEEGGHLWWLDTATGAVTAE